MNLVNIKWVKPERLISSSMRKEWPQVDNSDWTTWKTCGDFIGSMVQCSNSWNDTPLWSSNCWNDTLLLNFWQAILNVEKNVLFLNFSISKLQNTLSFVKPFWKNTKKPKYLKVFKVQHFSIFKLNCQMHFSVPSSLFPAF